MKKVYVSTIEQLNNLYNQSALTWEGLSTDEENLNAIENWLKEHEAILADKEPIVHIITGRLMNKVYGLTGNNSYPNDLNLISVTNIDQMKVIMPRFEVGGRWFDDIVDNNASREGN